MNRDKELKEKLRIIKNAEADAAYLYGELKEIKETMDGHFDDTTAIDSIVETLYSLKDCVQSIRNVREKLQEEVEIGKDVDYERVF